MVPARDGSGSQTFSPYSDMFSSMFGDALSLYSTSELYGQIVVYGIWSLVMLFQLPAARKNRTHLLQAAMFSFLIAFALHCTRYGLLLTGAEIFPAYRYESSVIVLFTKIGTVSLFAATLPSPSEKLPRFVLWTGLVVYVALGVAYLIYDFLISSIAIQEFEADASYGWKLTDRDFGLTLTQAMVDRLDEMSYESGFWIEEKMYDVMSGAFHGKRTTQIKLGVATDYVAALLALYVLVVAVLMVAHTRLKGTVEGAKWLVLASLGLLLSLMFRVVVSTAFVLRNWNDVRKVNERLEFFNAQDYELSTSDYFFKEEENRLLATYNATISGFPIIQAILEPIGIVLACLFIATWWRKHDGTSR